MHSPIKVPSAANYVASFRDLVRDGARRFLLHGFHPATVAVLSAARSHPEAARLTFAICAPNETLPGVGVPRISAAEAEGRSFDAVLVFLVETGTRVPDVVTRLKGTPHLVYPGTRAQGVIVVSIPKSGTHLISRAMQQLGYEVCGQGGKGWSAGDESGWSPVWALRLGQLPELCSADGYHWLSESLPPAGASPAAFDPPWPTNGCLVLHELRLTRIDGNFFRDWERTNAPRIVFNFRDPRAVLSSYVRFLGREGFAPTPEQLAHAAILRSLPDPEQRLAHAIRDPTFPRAEIYRNCAWLRLHPRVCQVSYEELVGPGGGGTEEEQTAAVARIMVHLNVGGDPSRVARSLFDRTSKTFSEGRVDTWREEFTAQNRRAFQEKFGDVVALYGYEEDRRR